MMDWSGDSKVVIGHLSGIRYEDEGDFRNDMKSR